MTKIRLARTGSTHQPHYRVVVSDSRRARDGRFIEILGSYHPLQNGEVSINKERAEYWLSVGAQPSNTVIGLLNKSGVKHKFTVRRKPERTKEAEPTTEAATEAVSDEAEESTVDAPVSDEAAEASAEQPAA